MAEFIEVTVAVPIKLFIRKEPGGGDYFPGPIDTFYGKFSVGSISEITTFSSISAEDAAWELAERLTGMLSG